jgi:hypothetical protein
MANLVAIVDNRLSRRSVRICYGGVVFDLSHRVEAVQVQSGVGVQQ